jgi:aspartyl-tRNA(Asn)/glutamyl-tRNA(Gln) amidotransferase subunit A
MPQSFDLKSLHHSIASIHSAFSLGEVTAVELAREYLQRIRLSPHNAFITVCEREAISQAEWADAQLRDLGVQAALLRYPLLGIPTSIKDNLQWEGVRTTCASRILGNYQSPYTSTAVSRLLDSGAVIVGKTNLDEFAMGGSNENSAFGPVLHPTHLDRVPGGSSGGAASAIGAGLCVLSLGSDTGGSVRLPASYCGVTGFKPTYGSVSRYGLVAFASSLDQVGPMARTVADTRILFGVISGYDALDSTSRFEPLHRHTTPVKRVGVPLQYWKSGGLAPSVEASVRTVLDQLVATGVEVVDVSLELSRAVIPTYYLIAVSEASTNLSRFDGVRFGSRPENTEEAQGLDEFYRRVRAQFGSEVKRRILFGTFALSSGYADQFFHRACQVRELIREEMDRVFQTVDCLLGPVAPTPAFRLGEKIEDPLQLYLNDLFTIPANLTGIPAISVPVSQEEGTGLPIGIHLQTSRGRDYDLLAFADTVASLSKREAP